jgi:hypothetical protein
MAGRVTRSASRIELAEEDTVRPWKVYAQAGPLQPHQEEELRERFDLTNAASENLLRVVHGAAVHFRIQRDAEGHLFTGRDIPKNQAVGFLLSGVADEAGAHMQTVPYREGVQTRHGRTCLALAPLFQDDSDEQPGVDASGFSANFWYALQHCMDPNCRGVWTRLDRGSGRELYVVKFYTEKALVCGEKLTWDINQLSGNIAALGSRCDVGNRHPCMPSGHLATAL